MSESGFKDKKESTPIISTLEDKQIGKDNSPSEKQNKEVSKMFFFSSSVKDVPLREYRDFCIHIFCVSGNARAHVGDKNLDIRPNDCVVILNNNSFSWLSMSSDFVIHSIFIANKYLSIDSPESSYSTMGMLTLMDDPVVKMDDDEFRLCVAVCQSIKARLKQTDHLFFNDVLRRCVETLFLDIYNIRAKQKGLYKQTNGTRGAQLFRLFISMLENGHYKTEREVRWYASKLKITPKYLSEVCINASGHGASYWINRFTTDEIARLLHNPTMSINSISDLMNFATRSYFSHYVREHLGLTPKDYRLKVLGVK